MRPRAQTAAAVVVLLAVAMAACGEAVRRQGRVRLPPAEFYRGAGAAMAPYTLWCGGRTWGGVSPFPRVGDQFPRHARLRDSWRQIRDEALAIYAGGFAPKIKGDLFFRKIADDKWKRFYIKWYGPPGADARALCPATCALLDSLPEVRLAMFSILEPGARIRRHSGPFRGAKRYHLGLSCPPGARILVDGVPYEWRDGEDVVFDDTFVHEVENRSATRPRVVLFCDVETRMRGPLSAWVNRKACDLLGPLTTRANDRAEAAAKKGAGTRRPKIFAQ